MSRLENTPIWKEMAKQDASKRRLLLQELIALIPMNAESPYCDPWGKSIVFAEDIDWLLERLEAVEADVTQAPERAQFIALLWL
jgi:hypothetical protein